MSSRAGIVLAGGESRRMGQDKTQLVWQGETLVGHSFVILRPWCEALIAVLGAQGTPAQRSMPPDVDVVHDAVAGQGPLRAIATGLAHAAACGYSHAAVLSADIPLMTPQIVADLWVVSDIYPDQVILAADEHRVHPLIGVYPTTVADSAQKCLSLGQRALHPWLHTLTVRRLPITKTCALSNVNTPLDWATVTGLGSER